MKNLLTLTLASIIAGIGLGVALGYYDARPWTSRPNAALSEAAPAEVKQQDGQGAVLVIDDPTFKFDRMERGASMRHDFEIKNTGDAPLTVSFVSHTCKCTKVELGGKEASEGTSITVKPGQTGVASLEWEAKVSAGPFRHGATFSSNDPRQSRVELTVEGDVVESSTLQPPYMNFGAIQIGSTGEAQAAVVAYVEPEVKIESWEIIEPEVAKQTEVFIEPLPAAEFPDPKASATTRIRAVYKPAGVMGRFSGTLRIVTNLQKAERLVLPLYGSVRGDITIYGTTWNDEQGLLRMPKATSSEGAESKLTVNIRGERAADTELTIANVEPQELQAELGEPVKAGASLTRYPLTVTIPKGTRPMVRFGEEQGGEGLIVIKTTNPAMPELRMRVHFAVKPEGR